MQKKVLTDIKQPDTAVEFIGVTKTFPRSKSAFSGKEILKRLISPRKETMTALQDVSFTVQRGEFTAYAGPNGAGKSTTMKLIAGILLPTAGTVHVLGLSPEKERIQLMRQIGVLFGNRTELWWDHPVRQSFEWKKAVWNIPDGIYKKKLSLAVEMLELEPLLNTFARELSLGQRMKADLAMLLLHSPSLLLLDEPTLGLDVTSKRQIIDFLKNENRQNGTTVLVTSHDMDDLEEMTKRIIMISSGRIAYDGDFDGLRTQTRSLSRLLVTADPSCDLSAIPCRLSATTDNLYEFEFDPDKIPFRQLLKQLSYMDGIQGVEIKKAPIEQVISELYSSWQN